MSSDTDRSCDKRARILEAAYRVCERCGVDGARMEEVAGLAQVSKGTLYRFFESKEHLLLATLIDSYEQLLDLVDLPVGSDAGPRERLDALLDAMTRVLEEFAPRMNVHYQAWGLVAKVPELQDRLHGFLREFHGERAREVEQTVREGQHGGVFRRDADAVTFADGVQALLSGFLYRATFDPEQASPGQLRTCLSAMVRDGLLPESTREGEEIDG
jgi:AcrR family transcriptional regulator